jgi:hypothetical protein
VNVGVDIEEECDMILALGLLILMRPVADVMREGQNSVGSQRDNKEETCGELAAQRVCLAAKISSHPSEL